MNVEPVKFFGEYEGLNLVAVCPSDTTSERNHARKVWIYPDNKSMDQPLAALLLQHLRGIDPDVVDIKKIDLREMMDCAAGLNWLVTEFLGDSDVRQVHFAFSVEKASFGHVVAVVLGTLQDNPQLEGNSLESSD